MRICLVSDKYPPDMGGLPQAVARHARSLVQTQHKVHVFVPTASVPTDELRTRQEDGITIHRLGPHKRQSDTLAAWGERLIALDQQFQFDLLHGYMAALAGFVATYVARHREKRSVVSVRGNDLDSLVFDSTYAPFVFKALSWADAVTAVSRDLAHKAYALAGRQDTTVIPNSVDSELFSPDKTDASLHDRLGLNGHAVLGFVGEARAKKGLVMLLRACARVAEQVPIHLVFVGGALAKDRPVMDLFVNTHPDLSIRQIPYQPHGTLPAYYNLMDLVLIPSLRSELPNTLLEAMACERAVIASAVGGILDVVNHGEDGWLVPPEDEDALVQSILTLIADPETRRHIGAAARAKMRQEYAPQIELERYLAVYGAVLSG